MQQPVIDESNQVAKQEPVTPPKQKVHGIHNISLIVGVLASVATAVSASLEDKKLNLKDLPKLPDLIKAGIAASEIKFGEALPEISDLSGEELDELEQVFKSAFKLKDESREQVVEKGFKILLDTYTSLQNLKDLGLKMIGR